MVYSPGFDTGKTFKTVKDLNAAAINGWITPEYITAMAKARPDLFQGIEDPSSLVTKNYWEGESGPVQQGYALDPKLQQILSGMTMNRVGVAGIKDGRTNALIDAQGNLIYADKPYSYDPAGDTWKSALEAAALGAAAFGGIGALGHGPLAGLFGGSGATGAGIADAGGLAAQNAALDAAMIDAGASSAGGWGGMFGGAEAAGGLGSLGGSGLIDSAFADLATSAGSLAPEGVGALIPTGAELGAIGGGGILAGGPLGGAVGGAESSWLDTLLGKAGDKAKGAISGQLKKLLPGGDSGDIGDWAKYILPALAGYASYKDAKQPTLQGYTGGIQPRTATQSVQQSKYGPVVKTKFAAGGGIPRYLDSAHDGMADGIGALIDGKEQAALSGGEFVIPADVVSHIGNGNSNAGAKQLYQMMDRIRAARTGTTQQGREINPNSFLPK